MTFRDVEEIKRVFMRVLVGVHHPRIKYPDESSKQDDGENGIDTVDDDASDGSRNGKRAGIENDGEVNAGVEVEAEPQEAIER